MQKVNINIDDKFNDWTVIDLNVPSRNKSRYVKCRCKCGVEKEIHVSALVHNRTKSCKSCARRKTTTILNIGDKYKHWTILEGPIYKNNTAYYKVQCDCGETAYKLPIELLNPNKDFFCKKCGHKYGMEKIRNKNGQKGNLTLTRHTALRRAAEVRGYKFEVSIEYLWNLFQEQNQICAITGDYITSIKEASLDRIDSSKDYVEGNVQWVTKQANLSKHIMSMNELYEFCKKVLKHANQQPSTPLTKCEGSETNS